MPMLAIPTATKGESRMTEKVVRIMCPNLMCRSVLAVPTNARGRIVRCKTCGTNIRIPKTSGSASDGEARKKSA